MRRLKLSIGILIASSALTAAADDTLSKHALLAQKLAERDRLQREVDALAAETGSPQQIIVSVRMFEVSMTKLRRLGVDFAVAGEKSQPFAADTFFSPPGEAIGDSQAILGVIDALVANNVAKVFADPMLAVTSGRPASLRVGAEVPQPATDGSDQIVFVSSGTHLEVLAESLGDDKVRLNVRPKIVDIDPSQAIETGGRKIFARRVREMDTSCELKFGQSMILSGQSCDRLESTVQDNKAVEVVNEIRTFMVVTPKLVQTPGAPPATSDASTRPAAYDAPARRVPTNSGIFKG